MAWLDLSDQYDKIYRYCFFRLRDPDLAEDLTQETFLRFYRQISYEEEGKALAYLYTIARNLCLDAVRRARPAAPLRETDPAPDPFAPAEQRIALRQAIEKLPAALYLLAPYLLAAWLCLRLLETRRGPEGLYACAAACGAVAAARLLLELADLPLYAPRAVAVWGLAALAGAALAIRAGRRLLAAAPAPTERSFAG